MGKVKTISFEGTEKAELEAVYRTHRSAAVRKRVQMVLLKGDTGRTNAQIASIVRCSEITVCHWLSRYEQQGIEGLYTKAGRGRKPRLDKEVDRPMVKASIEQHRQSLKGAHDALMEQSGKSFCSRTLRRFLKELATPTKGSGSTSAKRPQKKS